MKNRFRKFNKGRLSVTLLVLVLLSSISIGYAVMGTTLTSTSVAFLEGVEDHNGTFEETSFRVGNAISGSGNIYGSNRQENANNGVVFNHNINIVYNGANPSVEFIASFYNNTNNYYTFSGYTDNHYYGNAPKLEGMQKGDVVKPGQKFDIKVIYYYDGTSNQNLWFQPVFNFANGKQNITPGKITGTILNRTYTLEGDQNTVDERVAISNNMDVSIGYTVKSTNENVIIADANGNPITLHNNLNSASTYSHNFKFLINGEVPDEGLTTEVYVEFEHGDSLVLGDVHIVKKGSTGEEELPEEPEEPTNKDVEVSWDIAPHISWLNHYDYTITLTNTSDERIADFTVVVTFDDSITIDPTSWGPNGHNTQFTKNTMTFTSKNQWTSQMDITIPANGSVDISGLNLGTTQTYSGDINDLIKSITITSNDATYTLMSKKKNVVNKANAN